ncbi:phosphate uptake regulator PhoU [Thermocladium modestius]|uniref:Phosphate uptake regulator PhoU n=1 Tax=Thermocladium modestius TaxID=62609 RepID=A0A830GZX8_9CREN|nr:phosphate uptake regulator PhoU [Thermocladium modestius]GGP21830.1 phosphate uptake regulator PhoU [Thermocladium modestius]
MSMYRKVIRIGEKSIGITLPKNWLDSIDIGLGDLVEVRAAGDMLVIKPVTTGGLEEKPIELSVSDDIDETSRIIIASYIEGLDSMALKGRRETIRRAYQRIEPKLPGSLILEEESETIIKIATSEVNVNLNEILSSMSSMLNSMFERLVAYLENNGDKNITELLEMDDQVDKLYFLALRAIKKLSFKDPKEAIDDTLVVKNMEHIADALDRTANFIKKSNFAQACLSSLAGRIKEVWSYSLKAVNAYLSNSKDNALRIITNREAMLDNIFSIIKEGHCERDIAGVIHESQLIIALSVDIAESTFSKYVRQVI